MKSSSPDVRPKRTPPLAGSDRPAQLALALALLLALLLGLRGSDYALWYDELASTRFAAMPLRLLWSDWMVNETNPPLYYSLLKLWLGLVGDSDVRIRLLSTLIGLGGVACAWQAARTLAGPRAAAAAALLVAVAQQHVFYGQMARGYVLGHSATLLALAGLTALAGEGTARARRGQLPGLVAYACGALLAVYSHTTLVLVPLLANLWACLHFARDWLARRRMPSLLPGWILANLVVLAGWSWWARLTWLQTRLMGDNIGWIQRPSLPYAVRMTLESYLPWGIGPASWLAVALFGGAFGWGLWRGRTLARGAGMAAVVVFAVGAPIVLFGLSLIKPVFLPRTVYFAAGPFLVGVAVGLAALPRRLFAAALAVALVLEGTAYAAWFGQREIEPWRQAAAAISTPTAPPIVVVQGVGPAFALQRYCPRPGCGRSLLVLASPQVDHWAAGMPRPSLAAPRDLVRELACGRSLSVLRWGGDDPARALPPDLGHPDRPQTWGPGASIGLTRWQPPAPHGGSGLADCPAR